MDYKGIRKISAEICKKNANILAVIFLIYSAITAGLNFIQISEQIGEVMIMVSVCSVASIVLSGPLNYGICKVIANNYNGIKVEVKQLFEGFKYFLNLLVLEILIFVYTSLWTLLFVIPGIIKSYSYSMAIYIFLDDPTLSPRECIRRSKEIMNGHKMELFCLRFSYIGWLILCALTFGILTLWVAPRMYTAEYHFYRMITNQNAPKNDTIDLLSEVDSGDDEF